MPKYKSHHFVPKFLLRNFATDESRRSTRLFLVDKRRHVPNASIRDQCARDYFYGKDAEVERGLADLEDGTAAVLREVVGNGRLPDHDSPEMLALITFIVFQWFRTPAALARESAWHTTFFRTMAKTGIGEFEHVRDFADQVTVQSTNPVAVALHHAATMWPLLTDLGVKVLCNRTDTEFVLGDAPAVLHNQWCRRIREVGSIGFACSGLQVVLPVSPEFLVLLYDDEVYEVAGAGDVVTVSDRDEAQAFNALQVAAAEHQVFYQSREAGTRLDEVPGAVRDGRLGARAARVLGDQDGPQKLVQISNLPMNVDLKRGAVRSRYEAWSTPLHERARRRRRAATDLARELGLSRPRDNYVTRALQRMDGRGDNGGGA